MTTPPAPDSDGFMRDVLAEHADMRQNARSGSVTTHYQRGQVQSVVVEYTRRRQKPPEDAALPHPLP